MEDAIDRNGGHVFSTVVSCKEVLGGGAGREIISNCF